MGAPGKSTACPKCGVALQDDARFCGKCGAALSSTEPDSGAPAPEEGPDLVGREIAGRYRILAKLGEGGMGAVYRAEQISLKREVALKVLKPELSAEPGLVRRFNAEAELAAKLNHPNTVTLFDFGQDAKDGALFIAMEILEGQSLRRLLLEEGPLPPPRALSICEQVCSSLADAHGRGIIHRDLKPDNVMLTRRGRVEDVVRVLDFGIAKLRDEKGGVTAMPMTRAGDLLGTPQYMAPEQIRGERVDARTDVYALGAMLYEMVTGRLPFEAPTLMAILSKHLTEMPVPPAERRGDLGIAPDLDALIIECLQKEPASRPQNMEALSERIARIKAHPGPRSHSGQTGKRRALATTSPPPSGSNYLMSSMPGPPPGVPRRLSSSQRLERAEIASAGVPAAPTPATRPASAAPRRSGRRGILIAGLSLIALGAAGSGLYLATREADGEEAAAVADEAWLFGDESPAESEEGGGPAETGGSDRVGEDGFVPADFSLEPKRSFYGDQPFPEQQEGFEWTNAHLGYRFHIPPGFSRDGLTEGDAVASFRGEVGGTPVTVKLFGVPVEGARPNRATLQAIGRTFLEEELGGSLEKKARIEIGAEPVWTALVEIPGGDRRAQIVVYPGSMVILVAAVVTERSAFKETTGFRRALFQNRLRVP